MCALQVVPEIEFPGHSLAALCAFPALTCTGCPVEAPAARWGVHRDVFCIGGSGWMQFLEGVLEEVVELFPSSWVHMGGDEVPPDRWNKCPQCQVTAPITYSVAHCDFLGPFVYLLLSRNLLK